MFEVFLVFGALSLGIFLGLAFLYVSVKKIRVKVKKSLKIKCYANQRYKKSNLSSMRSQPSHPASPYLQRTPSLRTPYRRFDYSKFIKIFWKLNQSHKSPWRTPEIVTRNPSRCHSPCPKKLCSLDPHNLVIDRVDHFWITEKVITSIKVLRIFMEHIRLINSLDYNL